MENVPFSYIFEVGDFFSKEFNRLLLRYEWKSTFLTLYVYIYTYTTYKYNIK